MAIVINIGIVWDDKVDDEAVLGAARNFIERSVNLSKGMGLDHPYTYQNYAAGYQDVFAGYGKENRERLRRVQREYDPDGVFSRLQPGYFKV
jgi:FAD/FMN-containing dehydrogenase